MWEAYPRGEGTPSKWLTWYLQGLSGLQGLKFRDDLGWARHRLSHWRAFDCGLPDLTQGRFISVSLHEDLGFDRGVARIPRIAMPSPFQNIAEVPLERSRGRAL